MKKLLFGALPLFVMISMVSCRDNNAESAEDMGEETSINTEVIEEEPVMEEEVVDSMETTVDSLSTSTDATETIEE